MSIRYTLTDLIADSEPLTVDAYVEYDALKAWYLPGVDEEDENWWSTLHMLTVFGESLGTKKPEWDWQAASFLGIKVEVAE